uniref:Uncharacterized protein n=1 Tax=Acrobeloides nanus TaxID=290746 RepID=A0A914CIZ3_9BILA
MPVFRDDTSSEASKQARSELGGYRSLIGLARKRLSDALAESAREYDFTSQRTGHKLEVNLMDAVRNATKDVTKIQNASRQIESYNDKWSNLIVGIANLEQQSNENEKYYAVAEGSDGYLGLLDRSNGRICELEIKINEMNDLLRDVRQRIRVEGPKYDPQIPPTIPALTMPIPSSQPQRIQTQRQSQPYVLPQRNLPEFNGDITQFPAFWERMSAAVLDREDIPDVVKLDYLIDSLKQGTEPARLVLGYKREAANLIVVKKSQLHQLPKAQENCYSTRKMIDNVEAILRQMEADGIDVNHYQILQTLMDKLPEWLLKEVIPVQIQRPGEFNVKWLRERMENLLITREETEKLLNLCSTHNISKKVTVQNKQERYQKDGNIQKSSALP